MVMHGAIPNIHNEFGLTFHRCACCGYVQCLNDSRKYVPKWRGTQLHWELHHFSFKLAISHLIKSKFQCKVCCAPPICHVVCCAMFIYVHSQSPYMSKACIHMGVHNHHVSIGVCLESLDIAYQRVANEVFKTPIAKNLTIVMPASEQFLGDYIFTSPSMSLEGQDSTCFYYWSLNIDKITHKHIWPPVHHQHKVMQRP